MTRTSCLILAVLVSNSTWATRRGVSGETADGVPVASVVTSLDGGEWRLATDPRNEGRAQRWWLAPRGDARTARVPWIIQATFPGYHGVAWYWGDFTVGANPHDGGRFVLRFAAVDYLADVWLNGVHVGGHEGGETPFEIDVTAAVRAGGGRSNRLAVRVLNPTNEPIDGITLAQTARRCKVIPYSAGAAFDHGGIVGPVELVATGEVRLRDMAVVAPVEAGRPAGQVTVEMNVINAGGQARPGAVDVAVAPAAGGSTLVVGRVRRSFPPGESRVVVELSVAQPRLWNVNDPYLYRAAGTVRVDGAASVDECSARFGFRDFRFADGAFRLNGRRIYLRSTHTCNHFPIGLQFPHDPDFVRRDLLNLKAMGFNAVRFIWGAATPEQLDYCDEIGLLVYEESYASAPIADSPRMVELFDANVSELIKRDRNHPSVVIWGLLNEAPDGPAFRRAVAMLPLVRKLDATRMVLLNSGRYDNVGRSAIGDVAGLKLWPKDPPSEPWVGVNATRETVRALGITWPPGRLALHPGAEGESSVVRWTAAAAGTVELKVVFTGIAERATTDVHVLHNGRPVFDGGVNLGSGSNQASYVGKVAVASGDTIDAVVGYGNGSYGADSTALSLKLRTPDGRVHDATADFSAESNPHGAWSYGRLKPGAKPESGTFARYAVRPADGLIGSLCNPGSSTWDDTLSDRHVYPRVPHTAEIVTELRTLNGGDRPVFLSEYGIGSAVDLWRGVRHFEQRGAGGLEDAQFFRDKLGQFLADYDRWRLREVYPRPEDFFAESLRKMASQRTLGLNAIRSNPNIVGHSLTGAIDHVMCGEGLTTLFRELKPGTVDALYDAWYPLRWCLFAEPPHVYRGQKVHLEAVLANEDALVPGKYPARLQVVGPDAKVVLDRMLEVVVPAPTSKAGTPLALKCFEDDVVIDGPEGTYQFNATFLHGAAAAGGPATFHVTDAARMPAVETEVVLWGDDPALAHWLSDHAIRTRPFDPKTPMTRREVILVASPAPAAERAASFQELALRVARGSTAVFLSPEVFKEGDRPTRWVPLEAKGTLTPINGWLYLKDEWAKRHPIFDGLPAGGLMDYSYYREIIPDLLFSGQEPPAEAVAGAIKASQDYSSGLMVAVSKLGAGRFVLNTLRIRENLGRHPTAERLLRNMLRYAARDENEAPTAVPADFTGRLHAIGFDRP
jgi:Glycosyl hydrolases family 2, TIM barrel domain/Glycosyl hydrolases family 2, sugar binding domain/Glycosyl hydrolases family 2